MSDDPHGDLAEAAMALLIAGEELITALRSKGMSRDETWAFLSRTALDAESDRVRLAYFNMAWPEETPCA